MDSHGRDSSGCQSSNETKTPEENKTQSNVEQELPGPLTSSQAGHSDSNDVVPKTTILPDMSQGNASKQQQIKGQPELHLPSSPPPLSRPTNLKHCTSAVPHNSPSPSLSASASATATALSSPQGAMLSHKSLPPLPLQHYEPVTQVLSRTGESTGSRDQHTLPAGYGQGKEEHRHEQEEGNTGNHVAGSPTGDQETSLTARLNEDLPSVEELQEQVEQLKTKLHENSDEWKSKVESVVNQLVEEKQQHYSELEENKKIIKKMLDEKAEMEEDVEILRNNLDTDIKEHQEESTKNNSMISSLKKTLNVTAEEKSSVQQKLQRVTSDLKDERQAREEQHRANKRLQDQMEELRKDSTNKETLIEEMERSTSALREENEGLRSSLENSQCDVKDIRAKVDGLEEQRSVTLDQLLVMSVEDNNVRAVALTLEEGANIEVIDENGRNPLHLAAACGHVEVVLKLLQKGAKSTSVDNYGWNVAQVAAHMGHVEVLETLYTTAPEVITHPDQYRRTLLNYAAENNQLKASEWLMTHGVTYYWPPTYLIQRLISYTSWHLLLAYCLTLTRKVGLIAPTYMALSLLRTARRCLHSRREEEDDFNISMQRKHPKQELQEQQKQQQQLQLKQKKSQQKQQQQLQPEQKKSQQKQQQQLQPEQKKSQQKQQQQPQPEQKKSQQTQQQQQKHNKKQQNPKKRPQQQKQQLHHTQQHKASYGLPNLGNTCYMNSVLQCLYRSQPFTKHILGGSAGPQSCNISNNKNKVKGEVATAYHTLCVALSTGGEIDKATKKIKQLAGKYESTFQGKDQQEAHEFLSCLLHWLHEDLLEQASIIEQGIFSKSAVSDHFYGVQCSTITCYITRKEIIRREEPFSNISLPVTKHGVNKLQEVLDQHFMEQSLMWQCDACGKEHDCVQKTSMLSPPQLLIIHLSRYPGSQLHNKKLVVTFPERGLIFPSHQERQERTKEYQLYALCDHKGSMSFGHYTAICRTSWTDDASNWMFFSDTMVKPYSLEEALGHHTAHILFYRAVN